ncbi:YbjN domain-containing protein [Corynebacterium sp.]|uniref:YbjN domain-containing protein n=1 Tax=Corynebacterium sp. TaxID=1720 RepID=UPI003734C10A
MDTLPAVSAARIRAVLQERGLDFTVNDVDDTGFSTGGVDYWVLLSGEPASVVSVTATDARVVAAERLDRVRDFIDDWHAHTHWPVCALARTDDGGVRLSAHMSADWSVGVTDEQLMDQIDMGVAIIAAAFREFGAALALEKGGQA